MKIKKLIFPIMIGVFLLIAVWVFFEVIAIRNAQIKEIPASDRSSEDQIEQTLILWRQREPFTFMGSGRVASKSAELTNSQDRLVISLINASGDPKKVAQLKTMLENVEGIVLSPISQANSTDETIMEVARTVPRALQVDIEKIITQNHEKPTIKTLSVDKKADMVIVLGTTEK